MRTLRALLLVAVLAAAAASTGFALASARADGRSIPTARTAVLASLLFAGVFVPAVAFWLWLRRHGDQLDVLVRRLRRIAGGDYEQVLHDPSLPYEISDLARTIDNLRSVLISQQASFEEQRVALEQIVDSLGEGLIAVSAQGKVVVANRRVSEIFGTPGVVVGRSYLEVVRKQSLVEAIDKALRGEASTDRVSIDDSGRTRQIELRVVPVTRSAEIRAVALVIDVTTIERLQMMRKNLLEDFSHEVRTPLAGLRSAVETYEQGGLTVQQEEQLRSVMLRQLKRIERLVGDLAELNRIESGQLILERRNVDLASVLNDLCDEFRERQDATNVVLTRRGPAVFAHVDPSRAQQVFANLLDNAFKHGGRRGEILIETSLEYDDAVVRISDEGEGIPPTEFERIFHRFHRVDKSRSQQVPGTGLGLAIAKHLVLQQGGTIRAHNRAGQPGATFEVRFRAVHPSEEEKAITN